jgi:phosphoribosyl 1,2-cyclic phosphodiesterase
VAESGNFSVRFWGVRGSIACPGEDTVRYGGNTSCLEVFCGGKRLIFDAGTGLRSLGDTLGTGNGPVQGDIFLSHTHFDHICGIPFFKPFYVKGNKFRVWAGHLLPKFTLQEVLANMMVEPLFPVPSKIFEPQVDYRDFKAGDELQPFDGVAIKTAPLDHPDRATGFRVEYDGRALCYITDTGHKEGQRDEALVSFVRDADLMVYDSTYTDDEFPRYRDYGHSTWQEGVRVATEANVKRMVIFHHDPSHDDGFMDGVAAEAEAMRPGTIVAREGMVLEP